MKLRDILEQPADGPLSEAIYRAGGEYVPVARCREVVAACSTLDVAILGVEGFEITPDATRPIMDTICDFTSEVDRSSWDTFRFRCNARAEEFFGTLDRADVSHFDFVLEQGARASGARHMRSFDIRSLIRPDLLEMPGYVPIEPTDVLAERLGIPASDVIKLDGNENPFGPSPRALEAIRAYSDYHIYPDPDQRRVREALAGYVGADAERIVCGLGSDDLIDLILRAVVSPGDARSSGVINCPPTFGMYPFSTEIAGGRVIEVPRAESFALDLDAIVRAAPGAKAIFLASPNNPTGNRLSDHEITTLLDLPLLVVIDEAYIEFAGAQHSTVPLVAEHENLVVLRTFSKWAGLAGLRAGYGVMSPTVAEVLMTIKQPYNLNVAAGVAIVAALEDRALLDERACNIVATRERMAAELAAIPWITPYPSEASFILCRLDGVDAAEVQARLAKRGIFVRHFDTPALRNHLRISAGLEEHVAPVITAMREIGGELGR